MTSEPDRADPQGPGSPRLGTALIGHELSKANSNPDSGIDASPAWLRTPIELDTTRLR